MALSDSVRSLGVVIDKHLLMKKHINSVLSSCCFHIKALRHIRRSLTDEVANTVARCIVLSRIDYCNSLLYGAPSKYLNKLQRVQNSLARIVLNKSFRSPAGPLLRELHWLPVAQRVRFKIASLVFRCRDGSAPSYLSKLLSEKCLFEISDQPVHFFWRSTNQDRRRFPCIQFGGTQDLEQFGR